MREKGRARGKTEEGRRKEGRREKVEGKQGEED
jgi:hypothetical protein